jgi:hypothetical protein
MVEDREALLQHYRQSRTGLLAAIDGLTGEALTERSIDGWSLKDHLLHIALWDDVRASEVERISAGHESAWRSGQHDESYNKLSHDLRAGLSIEQAKWELETSRQRLLHAISSASPRGLDASLYGDAGLTSGHELEHAGWIKRWRSDRGI